ncbi:MAG: phosphatase PAP2 family protein [Acidobacteriota bacterium]
MFQTEPNLYLQSLGSDWFTALMKAVSWMGYEPFFVAVVGLLVAGVNFRKGFLLLQLMLWQGAAISVLKDVCALPRPAQVDSRVLYKGRPNPCPFTDMGAEGFFEPLPREVVDYYRATIPRGHDEFGFPSGHVQSTAGLWGGLCALFGGRLIIWATPLIVAVMALSRMYLGVHFLADVLGGAAAAALLVLAFQQLCARANMQSRLFDRSIVSHAFRLPNLLFASFMFIIPLLLLPFYPARSGLFLGVNTGYLLVLRNGLPVDSGSFPQRAARVLMGFSIFLVTSLLIRYAIVLFGIDDDAASVRFAAKALPTFMIVWAMVELCVRLGLYKREPAPRPGAAV